uniref:Putative pre-mRNA-splicing factor ATP-dependent RNA helicase DHX16 n=1 Tax=Rhizophora mucronata TaxID=61149 RepID=A0A2P2LWH0_RHIMU
MIYQSDWTKNNFCLHHKLDIFSLTDSPQMFAFYFLNQISVLLCLSDDLPKHPALQMGPFYPLH